MEKLLNSDAFNREAQRIYADEVLRHKPKTAVEKAKRLAESKGDMSYLSHNPETAARLRHIRGGTHAVPS